MHCSHDSERNSERDSKTCDPRSVLPLLVRAISVHWAMVSWTEGHAWKTADESRA